MNRDTVAHLSKEGQTSAEELQNKESVNPYPINQKYSLSNISSPQQPTIIDWYFIYPYGTYYLNTSIARELNSSKENIVVNDNSSSTNLPKSILKSKHEKRISKKRISFSPNTMIGSETIKDLSEVINNQRSRPVPVTTTTVSMTPYMTQQLPNYYNPQPSTTYTFIPSNIYLAVANAISFLYYSY